MARPDRVAAGTIVGSIESRATSVNQGGRVWFTEGRALAIHRTGLGVAGVYVLEVAETKVSRVHQAAEERGYPLRAGVEKE